MLRAEHQTKTIQELVDLYSKRRLNLSPAFQRESVWTLADRRQLMVSLFEGLPIPSIYLYRRSGPGGTPVYDVIDGKQRLESILLYLKKGPLAQSLELLVKTTLDGEQKSSTWAWKDLNNARRHAFLTTKVPTIEVEGEFNEIIDLFIRINSTGKRLEGQEKRHARFYASPVLKVAQRLGDQHRAFLLGHRILSEAQVQRMKHVELMTELVLATHAGVHLNKKAKIDEIIRGDVIEVVDLNIAAAAVTRTLKLVESVLPDLKTTRFRQVADFYTLAMLLHSYREEGKTVTAHDGARNRMAGDLLRNFALGVDEVSQLSKSGKGVTPFQQPFLAYLLTVREGTDSAAQRKAREKLLRALLDGVFDHLDPTRQFNQVQRRILWHASAKKSCTLCGLKIRNWEDVAIDHIEPYIKGGKTRLSNAGLTHKSCNSKWGAKSKSGGSR